VGDHDGTRVPGGGDRGVRFHDDRGVQNKVSEYGHGSEGMLESIESTLTALRENPRGIFLGELGKRDHNVRVVENEPAVEVGKS